MAGEGLKLRRFLRDPMFHFAVLGVAIFVADRVLNESEPALSQETIVVTDADIDRLASVFEERWGRAPTDTERVALIDDFVREEILYREAVALGLDQGDTIVRRRLAQKLAFLSQDNAAAVGPNEDELRAWFEANRSFYEVPPRYSFVHVFYDRDRRDDAAADAAAALEQLRGGNAAEAIALGDEPPMPKQLNEAGPVEIDAVFGAGFAARLAEAPVGKWFGPIASEHGLHLVSVRQRLEGYAPVFEDVREVVESDWLAEQARRVDPEFYEDLRDRYRIVVKNESK